ncbi:MAG: hypothetical protein K8I03_12735 [Ignavibacteria bacterium]|nr:hypothetical protein [Ignavibacteria bacterium]
MAKFKIANILKSFRGKLIIIIALVVIAASLVFTKFFLKNESQTTTDTTQNLTQTTIKSPADIESLKPLFETGIDSVLHGFGIKKEWISSNWESKTQKGVSKNIPHKDAEWFSKTVLIPPELSSIEVNADLSSYISSSGLSSTVNEDIITKDITIIVENPDSTKKDHPLGRISVVHSDKISRESAIICVVLSGIADYKDEEIDRLLLNKSEFSFVFPRNLDEIDIQNKLLHNKKDVIINLTIGGRDNYDTDFNTNLDEKGIREKVKSFSSDFPTIQSVILTKAESDVPQTTVNVIAEEFAKFNIKVITESSLVPMITKAEESAKDKLPIIAGNIKSKSTSQKSLVTLLHIDAPEFNSFYDEIMTLKKLGYKFYNYTEYFNRKAEFDKKEQEKTEKLKAEQDEKKKQLDLKKQQDQKKKLNDKKKTDTKKTDTKKTDKKKTEQKKSEPKKKTDVKKTK